MRGYSVLFVCALCVFVLCGAAAVVAQDVTPEKLAAEAAKAISNMAKEKVTEALAGYTVFEIDVTAAVRNLETADTEITNLKTHTNGISELQIDRSIKQGILHGIEELESKVQIAKIEVRKLKDAEIAIFKDQVFKKELENRMNIVERHITEAETAAKNVTDELRSTNHAIEKAILLKITAIEAWHMWCGALIFFEALLDNAMAAINAVKTAKNEMEQTVRSFSSSRDPETAIVTTALLEVVNNQLNSSLEKMNTLKTTLENATESAAEAKYRYDALAKKAEELKQAAMDRKLRIQKAAWGARQLNPIPSAPPLPFPLPPSPPPDAAPSRRL